MSVELRKHFGLSLQEWALMLVTCYWGVTFVVVKYGLGFSGPVHFVMLRFLFAAIMMSVVCWRILKDVTRYEIFAGVAIGMAVFVAYTSQTVGLKTILSSQSAFVTAFYVPMVPILQWLLMRKPPSLMNWVGIICASIGTLLVASRDGISLSFSFGEIITLCSAVAFAFEITLFSVFSPKVNVRRLAVIQSYFVALMAFLYAPFSGEATPHFSWQLAACIAFMGVGSAIIQVTMGWAQRSINPTRATLIYTCEPVWGGVAGVSVGERLGAWSVLGAILIVAGVLMSEVKFKLKRLKRG